MEESGNETDALHVTVLGAISGESIVSLGVHASTTVLELKKGVEPIVEYPASSFQLLLNEDALESSQTMETAGVTDGASLLLIQNPPYLHIEPSGVEYLQFPHGDKENYSSSFLWKGGVTAKTYFSKVRFDSVSLRIHTGDFRFARVEVQKEGSGRGEVGDDGFLDGNPGKWTPYATCLDCSAPLSKKATARIDLRGTPYKIVDGGFAHGGYRSSGKWVYSENGQVVEVCGGGYCGWAAPSEAVSKGEVDEGLGGWFLQLEECVPGE